MDSAGNHHPGDVFQITKSDPDGSRTGWVGAFVLATEIRTWGIQGYVHGIDSDATSTEAYIRLDWKEIDYIGQAALVPQSVKARRVLSTNLKD